MAELRGCATRLAPGFHSDVCGPALTLLHKLSRKEDFEMNLQYWVRKSTVECKWFVALVTGVSLLCLLPASALPQSIPFGTNIPYAAGILPNNQTQAQLNATTAAFYDQWKARYLIP